MAASLRIIGGVPLRGSVDLPPDAAVARLALLLAALGTGESRIEADLEQAECGPLLAALRALGVELERDRGGTRVNGRGLSGLAMPTVPLHCGGSRHTLALLAGALCAQPFGTRLVLDACADSRPLDDIVGPLRARGAHIAASGKDGEPLSAPVSIAPLLAGEHLAGLQCTLALPDPEAKSAILLSGLGAAGATALSEPLLSADHTERMLLSLGVPVRRLGSLAGFDPLQWDGRLPSLGTIALPGDTTVAAFVAAAACALPHSRVALRDVGMNPTRSGFFDALRLWGAQLLVVAKGDRAGREPIAEVQVHASSVRGGAMGGEIALRCGDSLPALVLLGARATRGLQLYDGEPFAPAGHADWQRLAELARAFGAECRAEGAGLLVAPGARLHAAHVDAGEDRRLALAAVLFALAVEGESRVDNAACIAADAPGAIFVLRELGARIDIERDETPS